VVTARTVVGRPDRVLALPLDAEVGGAPGAVNPADLQAGGAGRQGRDREGRDAQSAADESHRSPGGVEPEAGAERAEQGDPVAESQPDKLGGADADRPEQDLDPAIGRAVNAERAAQQGPGAEQEVDELAGQRGFGHLWRREAEDEEVATHLPARDEGRLRLEHRPSTRRRSGR